MSKYKKDVSVDSDTIVDEKQFVTFLIGGETYGVSADKVQEIIGITEITYVPQSLPYVKGVINLRGSVVPVIDMRLKFKIDELAYAANTVIIIVRMEGRLVGLIVDAVSDVMNIPVKGIQETPHFSAGIDTDYIESVGQSDQKLIIILNVNMLITSDEFEGLRFGGKKK